MTFSFALCRRKCRVEKRRSSRAEIVIVPLRVIAETPGAVTCHRDRPSRMQRSRHTPVPEGNSRSRLQRDCVQSLFTRLHRDCLQSLATQLSRHSRFPGSNTLSRLPEGNSRSRLHLRDWFQLSPKSCHTVQEMARGGSVRQLSRLRVRMLYSCSGRSVRGLTARSKSGWRSWSARNRL